MIKITDNNGSPKDLIKRFFGTIPIIKVYNSTSLIWSAVKELLQNYSFMYSQTGGGNLSVDVKKGNILKIQGNTIAWNQGVKNGNFENVSIWILSNNVTYTVNNNIASIVFPNNQGRFSQYYVPLVENHTYYICYNAKASNDCTIRSEISYGWKYFDTSAEADKWVVCHGILKAGNATSTQMFQFHPVTNPETSVTIEASYVHLIDLTLIYGAGNEPSTPEQFEADYFRWFGKPLTYEPYDEGSLRSVKMSGLKTIGFNQWDEEWEVGQYNASGQKTTDNTAIRSKNYIPVLPNTNYYYPKTSVRLCAYDANKKSIGLIYNSFVGGIFKTPSDCCFITFGQRFQTTYNNDICINISWSGIKDGTYEPYEENTISIPTTTMTGKLNGEGESVVIFPDGMKGVNDVHDEIYYVGGKTYAVKRVGRVDLGTLEWVDATGRWMANLTDSANGNSLLNLTNCICAKYVNITPRNWYYKEKIGISLGSAGVAFNKVLIYDTSYETEQGLTTALDGVYLDYELATPLVYELDTNLNLKYKADRNGTEEVIPVSGEECVAPIFDVEYT